MAPAPTKKVITINVPSWELSAKKAHDDEITKLEIVLKEFDRMQAEQEAEKCRQPTSLIGAIRDLNVRNANVRILTKDAKPAQGAQQRLRDRRESGSSVEVVCEMRRSPERGGERGTTSRTTARTSSPRFAKAPPVLHDSGEDSCDNESMELIHKQRCLVKMETDRLERMERRYAKERLLRK